MLVWASHEGRYGYSKASFGADNEISIVLDKRNPVAEFSKEVIDIVPPVEQVTLPEVTEEQRLRNEARKTQEDSIRIAYMNSFMTQESATAFVEENGLPIEAVDYLVRSCGNHEVIKEFLVHNPSQNNSSSASMSSSREETPRRGNEHPAQGRALYKINYLALLSDKDLRDVSLEVLDDQVTSGSMMQMRVEDEMLVPYKRFFQEQIPQADQDRFRKNPAELVKWCRDNLKIVDGPYAQRIAMSSVSVWKSRLADPRSRDIFFVNVAWSLGIEARKDGVTGKVQYQAQGQWVDVDFEAEEQAVSPVGNLIINYLPTASLDNPEYYSHFTISRIKDDGTTSLLSFDEGQVDMGGGVSWRNTFKKGVALDAGTYLLVSGKRMASGKVLASAQVFSIAEGQTTTLDLQLREPSGQDVTVIGSFDSESRYLKDGTESSVLATTGRGYFVVGVLGVGQEPTNHALRDIAKLKSDFNAWGKSIVLIFTDETQQRNFNTTEFGNLPSTVSYGVDINHQIQQQIVNNLHLSNASQLPLFIIADTFNRVVFVSQGYTIGLGEQLMEVIKKIEN